MQTINSFVMAMVIGFAAQVTVAVAEPIQVVADFPGGSARVEGIEADKQIVRISPEKYEDRGWVCWWYARIDGLQQNSTLTLDVGGGVWATPTQATFSEDRKAWKHSADGRRVKDRIIYEIPVTGTSVYVAWGPPFLPADAVDALKTAVEKLPNAEFSVLCKTRDGHDVPSLRIGSPDAEHAIWIQARQHAWESGSTWVCQGMIDWLTSAEAAPLLKDSVIYIVPIMDVDNVVRGAGGKNQVPQDHNRDWSDEPHWPSVRAAMAHIKQLTEQGNLDLFIDLHNPSASAKYPFFFISPEDYLSEQQNQNQSRLLLLARKHMRGPLPFTGQVYRSGSNYDKNWQKISKNWVTKHGTPQVVALTLETPWNTPHSTPEGYRKVGQGLAGAVNEYITGAQSAE